MAGRPVLGLTLRKQLGVGFVVLGLLDVTIAFLALFLEGIHTLVLLVCLGGGVAAIAQGVRMFKATSASER